eukprot:jgi/Tetstr1/448925/TSEL_036151.t1
MRCLVPTGAALIGGAAMTRQGPRVLAVSGGSKSSDGSSGSLWTGGGSGRHYAAAGGKKSRKGSAGGKSGRSEAGGPPSRKPAGGGRAGGRSAASLKSKRDAEAKYFWEQVELRNGGRPGNSKRLEFASSRREAKLFGPEEPWAGASGLTADAAADATRSSSSSSSSAYDDIPVDVDSGPVGEYEPLSEFSELLGTVDDAILLNCARCGYTRPTPIQRHAVPLAQCGRRDLLASAQTGSGKTAAFLLPMISHALRVLVPDEPRGAEPARGEAVVEGRNNSSRRKTPCAPLCLILAPTRELAAQISEEAQRLSWGTEVRTTCVHGGSSAMPQLKDLARGPAILVATPGRLMDFVESGYVSLSKVRHLVLDEADRMLDMGFEPQIQKLLEKSNMPQPSSGRQTSLFSATFPDGVERLVERYTRSSLARVAVGRVGSTVGGIEQRLVLARADMTHKLELLWEALDTVEGQTIIFTSRKASAAWYRRGLLYGDSVGVEEIHGDRSQAQREVSLERFRSGESRVLVATDVAARGIDISGVAHVINADLPEIPSDFDSYVHRIGRTGRAGRTGIATSLYVPGREGNADLHGLLSRLLHENEQEIPEWFQQLPEAKAGAGAPSGSEASYGSGRGKFSK